MLPNNEQGVTGDERTGMRTCAATASCHWPLGPLKHPADDRQWRRVWCCAAAAGPPFAACHQSPPTAAWWRLGSAGYDARIPRVLHRFAEVHECSDARSCYPAQTGFHLNQGTTVCWKHPAMNHSFVQVQGISGLPVEQGPTKLYALAFPTAEDGGPCDAGTVSLVYVPQQLV